MGKELRIASRTLWVAAARPAFWRILILGLVIGLSFMLPAGSALAQGPTPPPGGGGSSGGLSGITTSMANIAKLLIDFLIGIGAILMAVGFATGFIQGQVSAALGMPHAMASMWMRVGGMIVCFVGLLFAVPIANAFIDGMSGFRSTDPIHLPK
jgi:hypothetical protein